METLKHRLADATGKLKEEEAGREELRRLLQRREGVEEGMKGEMASLLGDLKVREGGEEGKGEGGRGREAGN
jgi:hypothetical protein